MGVYSFSFIFANVDEGLKFFSPSAIVYNFLSSRHKNSPRKNATGFFAPVTEYF